tara:strand:+ start:594 stop:962 length:369 start_codon:yes stop_codon:yes gene_type:complete
MTTFIVDKDGKQANARGLTVPSTRHFREAWSLNGNVITEDLTTAKEIFKDKIREVRKPLLETLDVTYMRSLEIGDESNKAAAITKKNNLRDAPAAAAISNATTIDELIAAWDSDTLGSSPYA